MSEHSKEDAWAADKAAARTGEAVRLALATAGLISPDGRTVRCPACKKTAPVGSKFKIFPDGVWQHFSSQMCRGDAFDVLTANGITFSDAVRFLAGKKTKETIKAPDTLPELAIDSFQAVVDTEVLNGVLTYGRKTGGVDAAAEFYGQWHISPEAVHASGAVLIDEPEVFASKILARFGEERLVRCGLFVPSARGPRCLVSENFPLVEPHMHPHGKVPTYIQLRASTEQYERYLAHKAGKRAYLGSEKFLSLRGTPKHAQIGAGLMGVAAAPAGATVYVVEGFKDTLAAATFGVRAYGVAGTGFRPPALALEALADKDVVLSFDGDDAGRAGAEKMQAWLTEQSVKSRIHYLRDGMDITDRLVAKHAASGCTCTACQEALLAAS